MFWVDLELNNPLDSEINLSNLTLSVMDSVTKEVSPIGVVVESLEDVTLLPKETRSVSQLIFRILANKLSEI